jgi:hypothetical protein
MNLLLLIATFPSIVAMIPLGNWLGNHFKVFLWQAILAAAITNLALVAWLVDGDRHPEPLALYIIVQIVSFGYWSRKDFLGEQTFYRD